MATPVIIDTDPGIDDAVAIFYALRSPAFDVIGITTVAGNIGIETTTENAGRILALAGADVPVVRGAARPISRNGFSATDVHGNDGLGGVQLPAPRATVGSGATEWIAKTLSSAAPNTIDLFALGPLTNLAHLVRDHPKAVRRVRRIVAMGGAVEERGNVSQRAEFNIAADPDAAEIVFASGQPLTLIPLDVTRQVRAGRSHTARLIDAPDRVAQATGKLIDAYFQGTTGGDSRPLHDPCVMLFAEYPKLFSCVDRRLAVDCSSGPDVGALSAGPHDVSVAMGVDGAVALARLMARFLGS
ncbi:MAG: nucleoside hydrolase [Pseudomonadota bacterium]